MTTSGSGSGPMGGDGTEHRVGVLEKGVERIGEKLDLILARHGKVEGKLDTILERQDKVDKVLERLEEFRTDTAVKFARIEEKLENKASASELAEVKGRVNSLPTTFQMITLVFGILGGAFLILKFGLPHGP